MLFSSHLDIRILFVRCSIWCAFVVCAATMALGQVDTATLVGRVSDPSGRVIVGARVELVDIDRSTAHYAQTNKAGIYIFLNTRPGRYRVTVSAVGYVMARVPHLAIYVQEDIQQNFRMTPGSPMESVTIQKNGTPVEVTGAVGTVVEHELVKELPLNGRSFQTLFQLTPGVVITTASFARQGQFSVNGQRTNTNYVSIDGVSANVAIAAGVTPGQSAGGSLPAFSAFGGTNSLVSTEGVQEFAVLTSSYSPEFGRIPGGQVSIVSRSGTQEFHGEVFEYLRNDAFDANDWFANRDNLGRPALRQNDYGGVLGGPLTKRAAFFFISYEGLRFRQPTSEESDVPTLLSRNMAPAFLRPILKAYPLPNGPDEGNGLARATYGFSNPSALDTGSIRIDLGASEAASVFCRYDASRSDHLGHGVATNSINTLSDTEFTLQTFTAALTYRFSSTLIDDLRFNWSHSSASGTDRLDAFGGATPFLPSLVLPNSIGEKSGLFQFVSAINADHRQLSVGKNVGNTQQQFNVTQNIAMQLSSHMFKLGLDFRRLSPTIHSAEYQQQVVFRDLKSAVDGQTSFAVVGASLGVDSEFNNYSVYFQDSWKPTLRLSISLGVRWDYAPAPSGRGRNGFRPAPVTNIEKLASTSIAPQGTALYRVPFTNFAPRMGIALHLRQSAGTEAILKGGVGLFYDSSSSSAGNAFGGNAFPFSTEKFLPAARFPLLPQDADPLPFTLNPPFSLVVGFPAILKMPYTWQWNVSLQQSLGLKQTINLGYVGARGNHLFRTEEYVGGQGGLPSIFSQLLFTNNAGFSSFNSLQIRFQRRLSSNAHILALYSMSHSLDNVSTDASFSGIPGRFINPKGDYGASDFDFRHVATVGLTCRVPASTRKVVRVFRSWFIDSVMMFRSPPPVDILVSRDIGFGVYDFHPDVVAGEPLYSHDPLAPGGRTLNSSAFSVSTQQRQGTLPRNVARGFSLSQVDLALGRLVHIHNDEIELRVEAFNVFNHPNYAPPSGELGSVDAKGMFTPHTGFGVSPSTLARGLEGGALATFGSGFSPLYQIGSARSLQLAIKFQFGGRK